MGEDRGVFTISLDFELYWGIFENVRLEDRLDYFKSTRTVIPRMLKLFSQNQVHVTWATVGMLFAENWDDWAELNPQMRPDYTNQAVNPYLLKDRYGGNRNMEYCFFAPELVKKIINSEFQELGTHTYSHYFCQENGQDALAFNADLEVAVKVAQRYGVKLKSLVFPRNQIRNDYLPICYNHGITAVRSNPSHWFWQDTGYTTLVKKIFRTGDAFLPLGVKKSFSLSSMSKEIDCSLEIPGSRFLRPHSSKALLNKWRLRRILNEMEVAAKYKKCYHLWWHPHNFGYYPSESLESLEIILKHLGYLRLKYGMLSLTMSEIFNEVLNLKENRF